LPAGVFDRRQTQSETPDIIDTPAIPGKKKLLMELFYLNATTTF
jgi:hypothetical protein